MFHQKEEGEGKEGGKEEEAAPAEPAKSASVGPQKKAAAAAASAAGSAEEWEQWMEASRVGVRRPLGTDSHKRCYWALGGRASAWRVYVEEKDSSLWGWYEGVPRQPCICTGKLAWSRIGRLLIGSVSMCCALQSGFCWNLASG